MAERLKNCLDSLEEFLKLPLNTKKPLPNFSEAYDVALILAAEDYRALSSSSALERIWKHTTTFHANLKQHASTLDQKTQPVESRKLRSRHLSFLKEAQGFQVNLVCAFCGNPKLDDAVRRKINEDRHFVGRTTNGSIKPAEKHSRRLTKSCYEALVHLGDLSRYREQLRGGSEKQLTHSIHWHGLAIDVDPQCGIAHYQLAVTHMLGDGTEHYMQAIYHLYRAATVLIPIKGALKSLKSFLLKIGWTDEGAAASGSMVPETPADSPTHTILKVREIDWPEKCLRGNVFRTPLSRDNFSITENGVIRLTEN